eukprot:scaffold2718_cov103-Isochrysis_galbana.AAC.4
MLGCSEPPTCNDPVPCSPVPCMCPVAKANGKGDGRRRGRAFAHLCTCPPDIFALLARLRETRSLGFGLLASHRHYPLSTVRLALQDLNLSCPTAPPGPTTRTRKY